MKPKHFFKLFLLIDLSIIITGHISPAISQDVTSSAPYEQTTPFVETWGKVEEEIAEIASVGSLPLMSLRVAGSVFKPRKNDVDYVAAGTGGSFYVSGGSVSTVWTTPVYLPQGAKVEAIRMYYKDESSAANCRGWFTVYDLYGALVQEWGVDSSGSSGNGLNGRDSINHTIDYLTYSYVLNWRPNEIGSTMQLHGFRIFYYPSGTRYGESLILSDPPN